MTKVMIVDDDHTTVKLLTTLCELDGFDVSTARRGMDVLPLVAKHNPDVILMDYHLTDMDGVEVLHKLRANAEYAKIPVVMASGLDVEEEAKAAGATVFLVKPFEPSDLINLFHSLSGG
ncbi:MAG: response regulator [Anaerolineae bacterium]